MYYWSADLGRMTFPRAQPSACNLVSPDSARFGGEAEQDSQISKSFPAPAPLEPSKVPARALINKKRPKPQHSAEVKGCLEVYLHSAEEQLSNPRSTFPAGQVWSLGFIVFLVPGSVLTSVEGWTPFPSSSLLKSSRLYLDLSPFLSPRMTSLQVSSRFQRAKLHGLAPLGRMEMWVVDGKGSFPMGKMLPSFITYPWDFWSSMGGLGDASKMGSRSLLQDARPRYLAWEDYEAEIPPGSVIFCVLVHIVDANL